MSGLEMRDFLIDHVKFLTAWEDDADVQPLLIDRPLGFGCGRLGESRPLIGQSDGRGDRSRPIRIRTRPPENDRERRIAGISPRLSAR